MKLATIVGLLLGLSSTFGQNVENDDTAIREIEKEYRAAWLSMDEARVMALFDSDVTIVPASVGPLHGLDAIRRFWFPKDSSRTTIHQFTHEILNVSVNSDIAQSSQKSFLSWSYEKGEIRIGRDQIGYAMTIYRRQEDRQWKIWRRLWTDVWSQDK